MTESQQGEAHLMSTLLLFFADCVGMPRNDSRSPDTLAHKPSQSLAHTQENGLNNQSMDDLDTTVYFHTTMNFGPMPQYRPFYSQEASCSETSEICELSYP